jgi:glycosyltransferase 2 family protein
VFVAEPKIINADPAEVDSDLDGDGPVAITKKPTWKSRTLTAIRVIAAVAIVFFLVNTTIDQWSEVSATFRKLSWTTLVIAALVAFVGLFANMMAWRAALADLDHRIPVHTAAPIMLVGTLGKYLPGSVWAYVVQMELGRRGGVPRNRVFVASLVTTGMGIAIGLLIGVAGLPIAFEALATAPRDNVVFGKIAFYAAIVMLPIAAVCAHPRVLTRLVGILLRLLRRPPLSRPISWRGTLELSAWAAIGYLCLGISLWLLARAEIGSGISDVGRSITVMALAMSVSVFVVIAPSGIGIREFIVAVALTGHGVTFEAAFAIALVARLIFTLGDGVVAGVAAAVGLHRLHHT